MARLEDGSPFPFGLHRGKKMEDVPAEYLDWLRGVAWLDKWPAVREYIERNKTVIDHELRGNR